MKDTDRYQYKDDRTLVADLMADDERAAEFLIYGDYSPLLRHNAMKVAAQAECQHEGTVAADDLLHDLYLYLRADGWARLRRFDPGQPLRYWLSVVSYRFFKDRMKAVTDAR